MGAESILLRFTEGEGAVDLETYRQAGGYEAARRALTTLAPDSVIDIVEQSGLRGKGGAGFPTGRKWKFIPKGAPVKYVVVNGDEAEPCTFKDHLLLERAPHLLVEGIVIASYAVGAQRAYVYVRREGYLARERLEAAVAAAEQAGFLGDRIFGTDFSLRVVVHTGAGAYIAGEESALLESLEGRRAMPRARPPFPAIAGLYGKPTVINNVETLCHVPAVIHLGPEAYSALGPPALFSVSGHVRRPGIYELPLGTRMRALIETAGGLRPGRRFKAAFPGGSSSAILTDAHLDVPMDYEPLKQAGSMLGSASLIVMDDSTCMVRTVARAVAFYKEESCGKCTPCREGTYWLSQVFKRILGGQGRLEDLELLAHISRGMKGGTCFCLLGDSVPPALEASLKHFRHEYEHHIRTGRCDVEEGVGVAVGVA
ncbi:MAG TPA: NADH-quinone oxidoreductase subunit NuoF [bacterium]|jgi:NADH-quinone oxidoreductase subunit F|nr:NADH-quinone oxidoreductase subunit NuoF [bacterium]